MDDVQFLIGRDRSEQEFFHTFNSLFAAQKQIVMTSDRSPREMSPSEQRLISRMESGVVADITPPDLETRIAIIRQKTEMIKFGLPDDVALFVAGAIKSHVRALEGALLQLKVFSVMSGHTPSIEEARKVLKDLLVYEGGG